MNSGGNYLNTIAIGSSARVRSDRTARIGDASIRSIGGQVNWTTFSDRRLKTNIQASELGLDFILKLKPVTYNYIAPAKNTVAETKQQGLANDDDKKERPEETVAVEPNNTVY